MTGDAAMTVEQAVPISCTVNGRSRQLDVRPDESLLSMLRERLSLTGTKEGCLEGECGACTVLVDDLPVDSCLYFAAAANGKSIRTIESLTTEEGGLSPLQQAFLDHGAVQCGFCTPGFVMTLTALLEQQKAPSRTEIEAALAGNICRCTGYRQIFDAVYAVEKGN